MKLTDIVDRARSCPFSTRSDFARQQADLIAEAASSGFITTLSLDGKPGRAWRVTAAGAAWLEENAILTRRQSMTAQRKESPEAAIVAAFRAHPELTADQCAALIGRSRLTVRPRFTVMAHQSMLVRTGKKRDTVSGRGQAVYRLNSEHLTVQLYLKEVA